VSKKNLILLALILTLPILLSGILVWRFIHDQQQRQADQTAQLAHSRLQASQLMFTALLDTTASQLSQIANTVADKPDTFNQILWDYPIIDALWQVDPNTLPSPTTAPIENAPPDPAMLESLRQRLLIQRDPQPVRTDSSAPSNASFQIMKESSKVGRSLSLDSSQPLDDTPHNGWFVWFSGPTIQPLFWQKTGTDQLILMALNPHIVLANFIALLPENEPVGMRIELLDTQQTLLHQWGDDTLHSNTTALSSTAWSMRIYGSQNGINKIVSTLLFSGAMLVICLLILLGGWIVYRELSHEQRLARQRVTFVNHVSHELKTPLTSIRMYADLLENEISESASSDQAVHFLHILKQESHRLARLIDNVLTFSSHSASQKLLQTDTAVIDQIVASVLEACQPQLQAKGIEVSCHLNAAKTVTAAPDALSQILYNLINNVEKYAWKGQKIDITTTQSENYTTLVIQDYGEGIPDHARHKIFAPFYRVQNHLSEGVAGTGIGLNLARQLARAHGGDLILQPSDTGACFLCTLHTPFHGATQ
jgi:signal transduction histidine kinase